MKNVFSLGFFLAVMSASAAEKEAFLGKAPEAATPAEPETEEGGLSNVLAVFTRSPLLGGILTNFMADLSYISDANMIEPILQDLTKSINTIIKNHQAEIDNNDLKGMEDEVIEKKGEFLKFIIEAVEKTNPESVDLLKLKRVINGVGPLSEPLIDSSAFDEAYRNSPEFKKMMEWLGSEVGDIADESQIGKVKNEETKAFLLAKGIMEKLNPFLEQNAQDIDDKEFSVIAEELVKIVPELEEVVKKHKGALLSQPETQKK